MKKFAICIDLDDTLIPNAFTYFQPQLEMAGIIAWDLGYHSPNPVTIINRATELQVADIATRGKISKFNFPMSYVDAYNELCKQKGRDPNPKIVSAIAMAGIKYFRPRYELYPGVVETLTALSSKFKNDQLTTILFTRGDSGVQQYKIDNTGINGFFNHIEIVDCKDTPAYLALLTKYELNPATTIMVGDSLRNDILPALAAGLHAVQVSAEDATDWEHSLGAIHIAAEHQLRFHAIKNFTEITDYIDKIFVCNSV